MTPGMSSAAAREQDRDERDAAPSTDMRWPPDRFFWGTLDAPGIRRPGVLPSAMALTFADLVPIPIEDLHAVMAPIGDASGADAGRVVVCAARRSDLEPLLASARSLTPASLPGFIEHAGADSTFPLNLLVGGFEPIASRQRRHRLITRAAMLWIALVTIAIVGLVRRDAMARSHAESCRAARASAVAAAMPGGGEPDLRDAVERLERRIDARRAADRPTDISAVLAAFLRAWPLDAGEEAHPEIQSIALNERRMALSVLVKGDPSPLLARLKAPEGWILKEPRLTSVGDATRLSLELVPIANSEVGQ